jgi:hypothetical protein
MIGSLSIMSKIGISGGEKVMLSNNIDAYSPLPETTYFGKPWMFMLRDVV